MVSSTTNSISSSLVLLIYYCCIISTIPTIRGGEIQYEFGRSPLHHNKKRRRQQQDTKLLTTSSQHQTTNKQQRHLQQDNICSCSPTSFTITLDFFNNCFDDTLSDNIGIADTDCTIEVGDPTSLLAVEENFLEASPTGSSKLSSSEEIDNNNNTPKWIQTTNDAIRKYILQQAKLKNKNKTSKRKKRGYQEALQLLQQFMIRDTTSSGSTGEDRAVESENNIEEENGSDNNKEEGNDEESIESIEAVDDINKKKRLKKARSSTRHLSTNAATQQELHHTNKRTLQGGGPASPTRITSITLIEIDIEGTVINIDNTNNNVNLQGGDTIDFTSISNDLQQGVDIDDQLDLVPSTQVLFMVGENARGEEVRGRFVWRYTNSCNTNAQTIQVNDEIAWSVFSEVTDQSNEEFCPANSGGGPPRPTPRPTSVDTPNPTTKPTLPPVEDTDIPTFTPTEVPTIDNGEMPTTNAPVSPPPTPRPIIVTPSPVAPTPSTPPPVPGPVSTPFPTTVDIVPTSKPIADMSMVYYSSVDEYEKKPSKDTSYYSSIDNILHHFGSSKDTWSSHHSSSSGWSKSSKRGKGRKSKKGYHRWGSSSSGSSSSGKGWYHYYNSRSSSSSSSSSGSSWSWGSSSSWSSGSKSGKKR